jgi:UDP-glucose 4-epimerase
MRVLVTGGAGYIGSVVSEELIGDGHQVVVYDNLAKGHQPAVVPGADFVKGDIADQSLLEQTFSKHNIEAVVHMAADSLVGESVSNPAKYFRNNLCSGLALLEAMNKSEVKRIVFSSTAAVYGEPEKVPIEESAPTTPTNPYGESKLAYERSLRWFDEAYGIHYASLRYFNAAGATALSGECHHPETHLIPIALQAAAGRRPYVEIYGDDYPTRDRTCVRDYIHVVDLARAHILALEMTGERSGIFNLGCGGEGYTVREVINTAAKVTGREIPARIVGRRAGDPGILVASSRKIKDELNWSPKFQNLEAIVGSAWTWMQSRQKTDENGCVLSLK